MYNIHIQNPINNIYFKYVCVCRNTFWEKAIKYRVAPQPLTLLLSLKWHISKVEFSRIWVGFKIENKSKETKKYI